MTAASDIRLDRRVSLQGRAQMSDGAGGFTRAWVTRGEVWAGFGPVQLATGDLGGMAATLPRYRVTMRAAPVGSALRPVAGDRLAEGPRHFDVLAVGESAFGAGWLTVLVEEEGLR